MATDAPSADGTVRRVAGGRELRFERFPPHPIARVWAALTEPAALAQWLAPGTFDLEPGGRARLAFTNVDHVVEGRVVAVEPPRLLAYSWGEGHGVVRWELSPTDGGTLLILTHAFPAADEAPSFLAGWHTHLELLVRALAEVLADPAAAENAPEGHALARRSTVVRAAAVDASGTATAEEVADAEAIVLGRGGPDS